MRLASSLEATSPVPADAAQRRLPVGLGLVRVMRPHQWVKNVLVFVPLVAAHRASDVALLARAAMACVAFCLCASSAYVINDLVDLNRDREHPTKRARPFAAGDVPRVAGFILAPLLLIGGIAVAFAVDAAFALYSATYVVVTLAYSLYLKRVLMLDVMVLAGLYTIRLFSGSVATDTPLSQWLLSFSLFLFLSLALVKRCSELKRHGPEAVGGRGYLPSDERLLGIVGVASGCIAVLVLVLYVNGDHVRTLYASPGRLWLLCPVMLYWIGRMWLLAGRGVVDDDPVVFALRDPASYAVALVSAIAVWSAI